MKDILDHEEIDTPVTGKKYRPLAMLLEGVPFLMVVIGMISYTELTIIGATTLSMIYMATGWYLFKGANFTPTTVIYGICSGLVFSIATLGILFGLMQWSGKVEMMIVAITLILPTLVFSIIWYLVRRSRNFEYTLSLKIISRLLFALLVLLFYLGLI